MFGYLQYMLVTATLSKQALTILFSNIKLLQSTRQLVDICHSHNISPSSCTSCKKKKQHPRLLTRHVVGI